MGTIDVSGVIFRAKNGPDIEEIRRVLTEKDAPLEWRAANGLLLSDIDGGINSVRPELRVLVPLEGCDQAMLVEMSVGFMIGQPY